jgi:hypothetical protein
VQESRAGHPSADHAATEGGVTLLSRDAGPRWKTIDGLMVVGWDSSDSNSPQSRSSLGASFTAAKWVGKYNGWSQLAIDFCSARCMRTFLMDAVDELERQIQTVMPEVKQARRRRNA